MDWLILAIILLILTILTWIAARIKQLMTPGGVPGRGVDPFEDIYIMPGSASYKEGRLTGKTRGGKEVSFSKQEWCDKVKKLINDFQAQARGNEADTIRKNAEEIKSLLHILCD